MANRKIGVTASEMRQLREEGLSNYDIAKALDISYNTVRRYIGTQGGRKMERLEAFKDTPRKDAPKTVSVPNDVPKIPPYKPMAKSELYRLNEEKEILIDYERNVMYLRSKNTDSTSMLKDMVTINFSEVVDIIQFLVWAQKEKIEKGGEDE